MIFIYCYLRDTQKTHEVHVFYEPQNCGTSCFLLSAKREAQSLPSVHCAGFAACARRRGSCSQVDVDVDVDVAMGGCGPWRLGETRRVEHGGLKGVPRGDGLRTPSGIYPYISLYPHYWIFLEFAILKVHNTFLLNVRNFIFSCLFFLSIHTSHKGLLSLLCFLC